MIAPDKPSPKKSLVTDGMGMRPALQAAKGELRVLMKAQLSRVTAAELEAQSRAVFNALLRLKVYRDARRISVYLSMPRGEVLTESIVRHALAAGKDVFVPYLHTSSTEIGSKGDPKRVMDMVKLGGLDDYEALEKDAWGIPTVKEAGPGRILGDGEGREEGCLDLILMPGVAFDVDGKKVRRLGHGKGFYDYFLHRYRAVYEKSEGPGVRTVLYGLALKEQFLQPKDGAGVPVGPNDSPLDGLVTGDGRIIEPASEM